MQKLFKLIFESINDNIPEAFTQEQWETLQANGFKAIEDIEGDIGVEASKIEETASGELKPEIGFEETKDEEQKDFSSNSAIEENNNMEDIVTELAKVDSSKNKIERHPNLRFAEKLIQRSNGVFGFAGHKIKNGAYRLRLMKMSDKGIIEKTIKEVLKPYGAKEIKPGAPGAASKKYITYLVPNPVDMKAVPIVFCAGSNLGHEYEEKIKNSVASKKGDFWLKLVDILETQFGILGNEIKTVSKNPNTSTSYIKGFKKTIDNVGKELSDLTLTYENISGETKNFYIQLKNVKGETIANIGYKDGFKVVNGLLEPKASSNQVIDAFINALGINKQLVADGINDYIEIKNGAPQKTTHDIIVKNAEINPTVVLGLLAAQIGYGYIILKENSGGFNVTDLTTKQKLSKFVGQVKNVMIMYPPGLQARRRKQCTVIITTTTRKFVVELRNTKGGYEPTQLNIKAKL